MLRSKVVAVTAASLLILAPPSPAAGLQQLRGHVPAAVAQSSPISRLPAAQQLGLVIGLPLRNLETLTNTLAALYDPASPSFHQWLTPDQFNAQFGPTAADYQKVLDFAQVSSLKVTSLDARRRLLSVTASVADIEKAFHMTMRTYQHPTEARQFYTPDAEPTIDASIPILSVANLNNYILPHPMSRSIPIGTPAPQGTPQPQIGSGPGGTYRGSDFPKAYYPNVAYFNGAGQYVGLLEFGQNFNQSDVTAYETQASLPSVPVTAILLDGYDGVIGTNNDSETALDIDVSIAMAPGLAGVRVYEGHNINSMLAAMANDSYVKQLSASWGAGVDATSDTYFLQFAMQGQSFFASSGDSDAYVGGITFSLQEDPNITIVGGTLLTTDTSHNYTSESVWNDRTVNPHGGNWGSSGGISTQIAIPSWQTGFSMTASGGSSTFRNIPDVALPAENIFIVYNGGGFSSGGTSASSPLWAGYLAVANQLAQAAGNPIAGFINPAIYSIYKGNNPKTSYANAFNDVIAGDNTWSGSPTNFFAVTGYDLCTGLGSPKAGLLAALSGTDTTTAWANDQTGSVFNLGTIYSPWTLTWAEANLANSAGTIVLLNGSVSPGARRIAFPVKIHAVGGTSKIGP